MIVLRFTLPLVLAIVSTLPVLALAGEIDCGSGPLRVERQALRVGASCLHQIVITLGCVGQ